LTQPNGLANLNRPAANRKANKALRNTTPPVGHHLATDRCQTDPDLALVQAAWGRLPGAVKAGIVAMVRAAAKRGDA